MAVNKLDITMMEDVGTSANQLLQRDGSGNLPAVDGSQISGITEFTTSTSDPAIDTNPSGGVGSLWYNKTGGEMYVCTDATAGENVWTNVGPGSGDIQPYVYGGTNYGYTCGGYRSAYVNTIDKVSYSSDGNAVDAGDLIQSIYGGSSCADSTYGFVSGGSSPPNYYNYITKFQFSTDGDCVDLADLTNSPDAATGINSPTYGYSVGGNLSGTLSNVIQKWALVSTANATDVGDMTTNYKADDSGSQSETYGYVSGNYPAANTIEKISFSSGTQNSTDHGDLTAVVNGCAGHSSDSYGWTSGGTSPSSNRIERFAFASNTTATDWADMTIARYLMAGSSSTTHGYTSGDAANANNTVIDKFPYASQTNSTDVGDLPVGGYRNCGTQY